jgi:hypothetical protein
VGFGKLHKYVTEVPNHRHYLQETENKDTCSIMVFLKEIGNKGCSSCFLSFSSQITGDQFSVVG